MSRIFSACMAVLLSLQLISSQTQDTEHWRLNFDQSPARHAYPASFYAVSEASHFLAERYWRQQQRSRALAYYQRAVDQGDAGAAYSLAQRIPAQREQWLRAALELGDPRATITIAKQLRSTDPAAAIGLVKALPASAERDELFAGLLFNHPHLLVDPPQQWQQLAPPTSLWQRRILQAQAFSREHGLSMPDQPTCTTRMTLFYHADQARAHAYDWLHALAQHPFAGLGLCFVEADAAATGSVECEQDSLGRAHCVAEEDAPDADFSIHVVDAGSANVRANHMAIAQSASFDIFIHEMAHLFALADEYPMREALAEAFCSGRYRFSALNLVITPQASALVNYQDLAALQDRLPWAEYLQQAIAVPVLNHQGQPLYQLGSPSTDSVGLFKVDTCKGTDYQAWRPVAEMTFMQQHEVGTVPDIYIELMRSHLQAEQKQKR